MICINCLHAKTEVTNSRPHKKQSSVWRRRKCPICGALWTTRETVSLNEYLKVINQGKAEQYDRGTLSASIFTALLPAKLHPRDSYWLVETIEEKLLVECRKMNQNNVSTEVIAKITYTTVKSYNPIAGLNYGTAHGLVTTVSSRRGRGRPSVRS